MIGEILRLQIFSDRKVVEGRPLARVILLQREVDDRGGQNVAAVVDANDLRRLLVAVGDDADGVGAWTQQPEGGAACPARYLVIDLFDLFEMKKRESKIKHGQERPIIRKRRINSLTLLSLLFSIQRRVRTLSALVGFAQKALLLKDHLT